MEIKTISKLIYIAEDGTEFDNVKDCREHEAKIKGLEEGRNNESV